MYKLLTKPTTNHLASSVQYWSSLSDQLPSETQWPKALTLPLRLSHCINHWEAAQKLFHKWYFTPERLAKIYPNTSPNCWRGCAQIGSLSHIWWECHLVRNFWRQVHNLIGALCGTPQFLSPLDLLLGLSIPTMPTHRQTMVTHILIAARLTIAKKWKSADPPILKDAINLLNQHFQMEFSFAKANMSTERFNRNWQPWILDSRSTPLL